MARTCNYVIALNHIHDWVLFLYPKLGGAYVKDALWWLLGIASIGVAILAMILVFSVPLMLATKLLMMLGNALF